MILFITSVTSQFVVSMFVLHMVSKVLPCALLDVQLSWSASFFACKQPATRDSKSRTSNPGYEVELKKGCFYRLKHGLDANRDISFLTALPIWCIGMSITWLAWLQMKDCLLRWGTLREFCVIKVSNCRAEMLACSSVLKYAWGLIKDGNNINSWILSKTQHFQPFSDCSSYARTVVQ